MTAGLIVNKVIGKKSTAALKLLWSWGTDKGRAARIGCPLFCIFRVAMARCISKFEKHETRRARSARGGKGNNGTGMCSVGTKDVEAEKSLPGLTYSSEFGVLLRAFSCTRLH